MIGSLYESALYFFNALIPPPHRRVPRDAQYAWFYGLTLFLLVLMAGLARRRGTWLMRLALFPFAMAAMLQFIYGFFSDEEPVNRAFGTWGLQLALKLIEYVHSPEPTLKLSEIQKEKGSDKPQSHSSRSLLLSPLYFLYDGLELIFTFRGFDWQFGAETGVRKPPQWLNTKSRPRFVLHVIIVIIRDSLICDVAQTVIQTVGLGGTERRSMFSFGGGNILAKYSISTSLHILSGVVIVYGLEMMYLMCALIGVLFCGSEPTSWLPLVEKPWISTSLHDLWGRRWHQLFRRSFLLVGGYPLAVIVRLFLVRDTSTTGAEAKKSSLNPSAIAIGTCVASAMIHYWDFYALSHGTMPGYLTVAFFIAQGVGLTLERELKRVTGKVVGGFRGWLWVFFWMVVVAQPFIDSWHRLGFLDKAIVPPELSPMHHFVVPYIREHL
ncbi:hypothetical protein DL93DRAFT_2078375 [Clavulina sp. PMI_390]|nr:hypothetical protein DL93DRAFT_2078375 [Clavulina sp. PMI_390]